jgi:ankyrin repeat protein
MGQTVLHAAARTDYSLTDLLLNHGADANVADKHGSTPLHLAIQEDCDGSMVNLLIVSVPGRKGCRQYLDYDREKRLKGKERKEDATTAAQPSTGAQPVGSTPALPSDPAPLVRYPLTETSFRLQAVLTANRSPTPKVLSACR